MAVTFSPTPLRTGTATCCCWKRTACVPDPPPATCTGNENSEVLLLGSVAVAVMNCPAGTDVGATKANVTEPLPLVFTVDVPRNCRPSPRPEGSRLGLEKNWRVNV